MQDIAGWLRANRCSTVTTGYSSTHLACVVERVAEQDTASLSKSSRSKKKKSSSSTSSQLSSLSLISTLRVGKDDPRSRVTKGPPTFPPKSCLFVIPFSPPSQRLATSIHTFERTAPHRMQVGASLRKLDTDRAMQWLEKKFFSGSTLTWFIFLDAVHLSASRRRRL